MEQLAKQVSPFRRFSREEWAKLRADTPLTLNQSDLDELRSLNDRIDLDEIVAIYLPLSRLLNLYVAATQELFRATHHFLEDRDIIPLGRFGRWEYSSMAQHLREGFAWADARTES